VFVLIDSGTFSIAADFCAVVHQRWISSPFLNAFELLGVPPGVGERDLRGAYVRLMRLFKPEQFPEHFRRIREAHEVARQDKQFFAPFEEPGEPSTHAVDLPPAAQRPPERSEAGNPNAPAGERPVPESLPPSFEEERDEAWNWAIDTDETRADARLLELHNRHRERSETWLRLYYLLKAVPKSGRLSIGQECIDVESHQPVEGTDDCRKHGSKLHDGHRNPQPTRLRHTEASRRLVRMA